jgi:uncharacterized membrane protein
LRLARTLRRGSLGLKLPDQEEEHDEGHRLHIPARRIIHIEFPASRSPFLLAAAPSRVWIDTGQPVHVGAEDLGAQRARGCSIPLISVTKIRRSGPRAVTGWLEATLP